MDLTTTYLGMALKNPIVPSASPLSQDVDNIRRMEDSGAAAVVMHSLFEEQITVEQLNAVQNIEAHAESFARASPRRSATCPTCEPTMLGRGSTST